MNQLKKCLLPFLAAMMLWGCDGCGRNEPAVTPAPDVTVNETPTAETVRIDENGTYDSMEDVSLYIYTYHCLPSNFMTKKEARKLGWKSGALNRVVEGKCIGGDVFTNAGGSLPEGEDYRECDIATLHAKSRGAKRVVYSIDDWDVYYTEDHYETFVQIYGGSE